MARWEMDVEGVAGARDRVAADPAELRACASDVARAVGLGRASLGADAGALAEALREFGSWQSAALDAVADAAAVLGGSLDVALRETRQTELSVASALGGLPALVGVA